MGRVQDKACVVTGAGSGIGKATALRLAEEGGKVVVSDINFESAQKVADEIKKSGGIAIAHTTDVSDFKQCEDLIETCVKEFGTVHVVVNSAGVNIPGVFHEVSNEIIDKTLNVNLKGSMYTCRAAIPHMLKHKNGSLVNISSVNGIVS